VQIIPVIDIRGGVAVAAVRGDRARYAPLVTPLSESADPAAVARGLSALYPFERLYVADLDGIEGRGADIQAQTHIAEAWLGRELWLDDGTPGLGAPRASDSVVKRHVIGSESQHALDDYERARQQAGPSAPLSLDFRGDTFAGPPDLLADASLWPEHVIVMTLARVGSAEGPDLARLEKILKCAGARNIYAAGGIRDATDLEALRDRGVAGALVATAIHNGRISVDDLERISC
jgi:uncharacterized protein related to proFAR isomerase